MMMLCRFDFRWPVVAAGLLFLSACGGSTNLRQVTVTQTLTSPGRVPEGSILIDCDCKASSPYEAERMRRSLCLGEEPAKADAGDRSPAPPPRLSRYRSGAGRYYCDALEYVDGDDSSCRAAEAPSVTAPVCAMDLPEAQRQLDRLACAAVCAAPTPQAAP